MNYSLTILEEHYTKLTDAIFSAPGLEGAAYLVCGRSKAEGELRLLVREVVPVEAQHYPIREPLRLSIDSASYVSIVKRARGTGDSLVFVHSHPGGIVGFSRQDDREEAKLHEFFGNRVPDVPHGSLVISGPSGVRGRIWTPSKGWTSIGRVRIIGRRLQFFDQGDDHEEIPEFFERQVRAFGADIQRLLRRLHVGVVGAGGTGSSAIEQLARLGLGTLSIFDGDVFDPSNSNRVYGSSIADKGRHKVDIAADMVRRMGLGTVINAYPTYITDLGTARRLRECDIVFGCADKQIPRGILVQLSLRYLIPVFDMGVKIDSKDGVIRGVEGRVTTLMPGEACLFCRGRISSEMIRLESLTPGEWQALADEKYAPEIDGPAPAVIPFTTAVAAQGVSELLQRLTGFMGGERRSSEVLLLLDQSRTRTNKLDPKPECLCAQTTLWGRGDTKRFLGVNWAEPCAV
jgi:molybdopterin/thiamine biosynthesis adenylyltransferase